MNEAALFPAPDDAIRRPVIPTLGLGTCALLALLYAAVLAALPLMAFDDRVYYWQYAVDSQRIFDSYMAVSPLVVVANEPAWLFVNMGLAEVLGPEGVMRTVIFVPAFVVSFLLLRAHSSQWPWVLVLLLFPPLIKNHIIHLRQGVAVALFLIGWTGRTRARRWGFMGVAPFVHSSMFLALALHSLVELIKRLRLGADVRALASVVAAVVVGASLAIVADLLGARQGDQYRDMAASGSGIGFAFWLLMSFPFFFEGSAFLRRHALAVSAILFYLGTYFLTPLTARIFESLLPLVVIAGIDMTSWRRACFLAGSTVWCAALWLTGRLF